MNYQKLFNYMSEEHGVTLLETDMQEICNIVNEMQFRPTLPSLPTDLEIEKAALRYGEKKNGSDVFNTAPITDFKSGVNWLRDFINQSPVVGEGWVSVDYEALYDFVSNNKDFKIPCFIDYRFRNADATDKPCRDIAAVRLSYNEIEIGVRGLCYISVKSEDKDLFLSACKKMNLTYQLVAPTK